MNILSIDVGTQSTRAMIFDDKGTLKKKCTANYVPYFSRKEGYAEQDADFYWEKLCEATLSLKKEEPELMESVCAVVLTSMRDTMICLDGNMKPLRPAFVWLDRRLANVPNLPKPQRAAFTLSGMLETVVDSYRITKSNWMIENEPEIWEKTDKFVLLPTYINYKLTGRLCDSVTNQVGHVPFDYKKQAWMDKTNIKWCVFNVEKEKLPELVPQAAVIGEITAKAAEETGIKKGLKLYATGPDKNCETLGNGCIDDKTASVSYGTSSTIQFTTRDYIEPQMFLPAYPSVMPGYYNPEIQIYRGFWMVTWFKEQFDKGEVDLARTLGVPAESVLDELMDKVPAGSEGLIMQPYWTGGLEKPEARGSFIGFNDRHTRAHIYRSIIEGICYDLRLSLEKMEHRTGQHIESIGVSGGGSRSAKVCQVTADVFGKPVFRVQTNETSGLGSAMAGFVGAGVYGSFGEAKKEMSHIRDSFEPDKEANALYNEIFGKVYSGLYSKLRGFYKDLKEIYK